MKLLFKHLFCILATSSLSVAEPNDFINFENDDTLRGKFIGISPSGKVIWKDDSAEENIIIGTKDLREVILNKGQRTKPFTHTSHVTLKNLDTIPGEVISLTEDKLTLNTDFGGEITIPRNKILDINIRPIANKIIYRGPFSKNEAWKFKKKGDNTYYSLTEQAKINKTPWRIKDNSLTFQGQLSSALLEVNLPDKYRITFSSYSTKGKSPKLIVMADLKIPNANGEDDEEYPPLEKDLGSSIVIELDTVNATLVYYNFAPDGEPYQDELSSDIENEPRGGSQFRTFYDLRVDKKSGLIILFANKRVVGKWQMNSLSDLFKGSYIGFNMHYNLLNSKSVISDIIVTPWTGVLDSAIPLGNETRDVVLLNNDTDRYSGEITSISDSSVEMKSSLANLTIPRDQVRSIIFAREKPKRLEPRQKQDASVRFYQTGKITGLLSQADEGSIFLESKILGKIKIKTEFIAAFEFREIERIRRQTFQ